MWIVSPGPAFCRADLQAKGGYREISGSSSHQRRCAGSDVLIVDLCWDGEVLPLLVIALIFGVVNALIRPLLTILTCPLVIVTLGLFLIVINALMLWLTIWISEALGFGFTCVPDFFWNLVIGAIVLSLISGLTTALVKDDE